ncbi:MAG: argininosuccinate synthase domain-containing protein [Solirubrobacteraceae bacterium]
MPGRHYVLAFSGGLDTSYALAVLVDRGERVTTVTVNTGGFPPEELREIEERAHSLGAAEHVVIDGRARLYEQFVSYILKANYLRNGVYPSCVGVERMLQAEEVTRVAIDRHADVIAHGSTGAGNDHVRFDAVTKALAPTLEIAGLIRDEQHTREEERDFLRARGHAVSDITAKYSFNFGILGTTIGGEETYGSWEYLPEEAWPTTRSITDAPDEPAELVLSFERGLPTGCELAGGAGAEAAGDLDDLAIGVPGYDTLALINRIGAIHGVGRGIHTGQTIMGIVGRLGFEAPGMLVLIAAHRELERLVLTNAQQTQKAALGTTFGDMLHEGRYYDPLLSDIRAFLDSSQERVTGEVRVRLHKGNIVPLGTRSPHSLLDAGRELGSTYGHGSTLWTGEEARAFAHIYATAGVLAHARGGGK